MSATRLTITISTPPPSLNVLLRMNHHQRTRLNRRIRLEVWGQLRQRRIIRPIPLFRRIVFPYPVTLTGVRYGKQPLDEDNLAGSLKPVIDALRWCKVITDDSPRFVSIGKIKQKLLPRGEVARLELIIERREP